MKTSFVGLIYLFFLSACISADKNDYQSITAEQAKKKSSIDRNVAYLKQVSQIKEDSFEFISKQVKDMIKNYEQMKAQLSAIEQKLEQSLNQKTITESQTLTKQNMENKILLTKKNKEQVIVSLSNMEDYAKLMAQILNGVYDISEEEKKKLLSNVKSQLNKIQPNSLEKESPDTELIEIKEPIELDEDSLLEDIDKIDDLFEEDEKEEDEKESEEEDSSNDPSLISAKKHFEEQSYETAISEFQKYRNNNPTGAYYPEATFYIGKSFEKLQMPIEAEVFFKEIVQSHPQSLWANRAKKSLKN